MTIRIVLVAILMMVAGSVTADARTTAEHYKQAQITRSERQPRMTLRRWIAKRLSRYAMAAN